MANLIVAFSGLETGRRIAAHLGMRGYPVEMVCRSASMVLSGADHLEKGIVICGSKLPDMMYMDLFECLPRTFRMIVIADQKPEDYEIPEYRGRFVQNPFKIQTIIYAIEELEQEDQEHRRNALPRKRNAEDERIIMGAKLLLMNKKNMTEDEAHKYLRRVSMESGTTLRETADRIRTMIKEEA